MSTKQVDAHKENQVRIYQNFEDLVEQMVTGEKTYEEVEEELTELRDDDDVDAYTFMKCQEYFMNVMQEINGEYVVA